MGFEMGFWDYFLLGTAVVALIVAGLYFFNRWATKKVGNQQQLIDQTKQTISIYVIDKKKVKAADSNLPKAAIDNLPRLYKIRTMPLVKAKIGPQIMTLICDKKVYEVLPVKKNVKVDMAGIYILSMKGMKSKKELKTMEKTKKQEAQARSYDASESQSWFKRTFGTKGGK